MSKRLTVFFSDIVNSTQLYQQQGDVVAHKLISQCLQSLRATVEGNDGTLLRTVGDAVLASFDTSDNAFTAAVSAQRLQANSPLSLRVGFHSGEVIPDAGDVYGNAVNVAARVASYANAEEILTTQDSVDRLSANLRAESTFLDRVDFKGIQDPLPIYRVNWSVDTGRHTSVNTGIVKVVNRSQLFRSDSVLELLVGTKRARVDAHNSRLRIGRDHDNDIVIENDSTSRHHAVIEFNRGMHTITDTSTNGTYIVRGGRTAVFLRRESFALDHDGIIGVGWHPSFDDNEKIVFRSVRAVPRG